MTQLGCAVVFLLVVGIVVASLRRKTFNQILAQLKPIEGCEKDSPEYNALRKHNAGVMVELAQFMHGQEPDNSEIEAMRELCEAEYATLKNAATREVFQEAYEQVISFSHLMADSFSHTLVARVDSVAF